MHNFPSPPKKKINKKIKNKSCLFCFSMHGFEGDLHRRPETEDLFFKAILVGDKNHLGVEHN